MKHTSRAGFTLVELAIVIVVIGLIVGGILAGKDLIRAGEINAAISEFRKYQTATTGFRDKYSTLPGDMSTASSYWSGVGVGDGDGKVENHGTAANNEISLFWIHLSNSSFIEGSYTNVGGHGSFTAGTNNPKSKMSGGGWNVAYLGTTSSNATTAAGVDNSGAVYFDTTYDNAFILASGTESLDFAAASGVVNPAEASSIDTKIDDGKPDSGEILSLKIQDGNTTTKCSNSSAYNVSLTTTNLCSLVFKTGY